MRALPGAGAIGGHLPGFAVASGMATVNLRLRGGPCDGEITTLDVPDANDPPERYTARVHGPHEIMERCEYRRIRWEPDGGADAGAWVYEAV